MITRDYLRKQGFTRNICSPRRVDDFFLKKTGIGYMSVRFKDGEERAIGLYAYSEHEHINIRKVVLSDTVVTIEDFELAKKLCHL